MEMSISIDGIVNISICISVGITTRLKINISISSNIVMNIKNVAEKTMWTGIMQLEMLIKIMASKTEWFLSRQSNPCRGSPKAHQSESDTRTRARRLSNPCRRLTSHLRVIWDFESPCPRSGISENSKPLFHSICAEGTH